MKRFILIVIALILISGTVAFLTSKEEHDCPQCTEKVKTEQPKACGSDGCCTKQ